jgi:hypothetical protein
MRRLYEAEVEKLVLSAAGPQQPARSSVIYGLR